MTQDGILAIARKAGLFDDDQEPLLAYLERFAALCRADLIESRDTYQREADKLAAENKTLRDMLRDLHRYLPETLECQLFHRCTKQHTADGECGPATQFLAALDKASVVINQGEHHAAQALQEKSK